MTQSTSHTVILPFIFRFQNPDTHVLYDLFSRLQIETMEHIQEVERGRVKGRDVLL